jgi:hypothetical protein
MVMKSTCHNSPIKHYKNGYYCPICFQEQFKPNKGVWIFPIVFLMGLMALVGTAKAPSLNRNSGNYTLFERAANDIVPTDSSVLAELTKNKCVLASVAVAQARIESGNYTSGIAINNKNLFGIKVHKCKYVRGERSGHATFATYKDNIACYCDIQRKYLAKIHKAYAEDTLYCQLIKKMK